MEIIYDVDAIKNILCDISELLKTTLAAYDYEGKHIANGVHHSNFCSRVHGRMSKVRCAMVCDQLVSKCFKSQKYEDTICFMGLYEACIPIIVDNLWAGHIVVAGLRTQDSVKPDNLPSGIDPQLFDELTYYSPKQINALKNILPKIIFNTAITLRFDNRFEEICTYIKNNLDQKLTIEHLCEKFHITKNTLYSIFQRNISVTINQYIADERLKIAKELIKKGITGEKLLEKIGIENYSYFSRFFKKKTGMTVTEYSSLHGISLR